MVVANRYISWQARPEQTASLGRPREKSFLPRCRLDRGDGERLMIGECQILTGVPVSYGCVLVETIKYFMIFLEYEPPLNGGRI